MAIDFERYIRRRIRVANHGGGRGYDHGVRVFDCPFCHDTKARGWMNVRTRSAGCMNAGCPVAPRLRGGAIEWSMHLEAFDSRGEALGWLIDNFEDGTGIAAGYVPVREVYEDWVHFPEGFQLITGLEEGFVHERRFLGFAGRQWGLTVEDLKRAGIGYTTRGKYSGRLILPIVMGGVVVAFQARAILPQRHEKYLTSKVGEDCGRGAHAILYNIDDVQPGVSHVVLMEGIADCLRFGRDCPKIQVPVGLLGIQLTGEKLGLLSKVSPAKIIVALDSDPDGARQGEAENMVKCLESWGMEAVLGSWEGAKDAASGGRLATHAAGLQGRVARRLKGWL